MISTKLMLDPIRCLRVFFRRHNARIVNQNIDLLDHTSDLGRRFPYAGEVIEVELHELGGGAGADFLDVFDDGGDFGIGPAGEDEVFWLAVSEGETCLCA